MGYTDKLRQVCAWRNVDQSTLASKLNLSKSTISRILSGSQEPKLRVAYQLAKELNVTLDALMDPEREIGLNDQMMLLTEDEVRILWLVREMGCKQAFDRLVRMPPPPVQPEP